MTRVLVLVACLAAVVLVTAEKARFDNYKVFSVVPTSEKQVAVLLSLQRNPDGLSFWRDVSGIGRKVDIMVPPHMMPFFKQLMKDNQIFNEVFISDLQTRIDEENRNSDQKAFGWTNYYGLDTIYDWLDSLAAIYPQVTVVVGGQSYEGKEIRGVKVSFKKGNPGMFIEAGIHAREWIAPATATFILNEVLTSNDTQVREIVEAFDWYVFPSVNPDGYEYTQTTDRMWRKTRSPSLGGLCFGADPNRNWGFHWFEGGSSDVPCYDTYAGSAAFSEIETRTLSEYITTIADKLNVYLALHSYAQDILIPYGIASPVIPDLAQHEAIGQKAAVALAQRFGTKYNVGNIAEIMYPASGGSVDWVKGTYDTDVVLAMELRDQGKNGFILPAEQIIPTGQETLDAVVSILSDVLAETKKRK